MKTTLPIIAYLVSFYTLSQIPITTGIDRDNNTIVTNKNLNKPYTILYNSDGNLWSPPDPISSNIKSTLNRSHTFSFMKIQIY